MGCQPASENFSGDGRLASLSLKANQDLRVEGQGNSLTVKGRAGSVRVVGEGQFVRLDEGARALVLEGKEHQVEVQGSPAEVVLRGKGHRVVIHEIAGQPRPSTDVEGTDQSVRFVPQEKHEIK